eukprot:4729527-Prymnesium_polylepis.1
MHHPLPPQLARRDRRQLNSLLAARGRSVVAVVRFGRLGQRAGRRLVRRRPARARWPRGQAPARARA